MESDYIGVDLDPGPAGRYGQVMTFGRDQERRLVVADDFSAVLARLLRQVRSGRAGWDGEFLNHIDGHLIAVLRGASGAVFDEGAAGIAGRRRGTVALRSTTTRATARTPSTTTPAGAVNADALPPGRVHLRGRGRPHR